MQNLSTYYCNETILGEKAASAQQVDNPIPPHPLFYTSAQCGETGGDSFPKTINGVNCPEYPTETPKPSDNCLHIISAVGKDIRTIHVQPNQVNILPVGDETDGETDSNIFSEIYHKPFSFYIPPQFKAVFFSKTIDTEGETVGDILDRDGKNDYSFVRLVGGNHLEVDTCRSQFMLAGTLNNTVPFIGRQYTDLAGTHIAPATDEECKDAGDIKNHLQTFAPNFIILQTENFTDMIVDMCVNNRDVLIGTHSLRNVWSPQSSGCDKFISNLCSLSSVNETKYKEMCSCFQQQIQLDGQFGEELKVSACCFGQDPSGDIDKSCAFNRSAYKTKEMLDNCCSFSQCKQKVIELGGGTKQTGVNCQGTFVEFPKQNSDLNNTLSADNTLEPATPVKKEFIPIWVWGLFGGGGVLLLLFLIALAFL
jgi:hypothetical protein